MKPRTSLLSWLGSVKFLCAAASLQYCHEDAVVEFCVAMTTAHNATTHEIDIFVTLGVESEPGLGWTAIGTGDSMAGSLMFFVVSDDQKRFALSSRTTTGHIPPHRISAGGSTTNLLSARIHHQSWQEVGFACYGCGNWPALDIGSSNQPWIFARNTNQRVAEAGSERSIEKHETYGVFYADMQTGHSLGQVAAPPALVRSRGSLGTSTSPLFSESSNAEPQSQSGFRSPLLSAVGAHGMLLGAAFMVLYPLGTLSFFLPGHLGFRVHLAIQLIGTLCCLCGIGLVLVELNQAGAIGRLLHPHPLFGLLLTVLVAFQIWLGYRHHRQYLKTQRQTMVTQTHRWNGRVLLLGGCINTLLGILYAKDLTSARILWGLVAATEGIVFLVIVPELGRRMVVGDTSKGEYVPARTEDEE